MSFIKRIQTFMALLLDNTPEKPDDKQIFVEGIQKRAAERKMAQIVEPDPVIPEEI